MTVMIGRWRISFLLTALLLALGASGCRHQGVEPQSQGLAALRYCGMQFVYFSEGGVQDSLDYRFLPGKLKWPDDVPPYGRQGWSVVLRGRLHAPRAGSYAFKGFGADGMIRMDGAWFPLAGEREMLLPQGLQLFELYQKNKAINQPITGKLLWRIPGAADFTEIPPEALSHGAEDLDDHAPLRPEAAVKDIRTTFATLEGRFEIPDDGFYRFFLRCGGDFRWGNICPDAASVAVDGQPLIAYYGAMSGRPWGFFDELAATRYFKSGSHTLEISGNRSALFATHPALRLGFFRVNPVNDAPATLAISEKEPGETVFRKGEPFTLLFERATRGAETYTVKVSPQRPGSAAAGEWRGSVTLPADRGHARGFVTYPCPEEGAFEYQILDAQGNIIEGPWEFVVVDPTPLPPPRPCSGESEPPSGVLVDIIDCAAEGAGGPHQFRDNSTSKVVSSGELKYRRTGPRSEYVLYEELDAKAKKFLKRPHTGASRKEAKGRLVGVTDQDWFAYTLKVQHPEKPHLITAWLPSDQFRRIGVEAIDPITGHYNGAVMEVEPACDGALVKLSFPFWPNCQSIDITTAAASERHGKPRGDAAIARIELHEYPAGFPPMPEAACGWNPERLAGWGGEQANLGVETRTTPRLQDNWSFSTSMGPQRWGIGMFYDYKALWQAWSRFGEYSRWRGDNLLVWPVHSYDMAHLKTRRLPWGRDPFTSGEGYRVIDKHRRNSLKLILLLCEKYGVGLVADIQIHGGPTPEMLDFIAQAEGVTREQCSDVFLEGGRQYPSRILDPSHPIARSFLINFYGDIARGYGSCKALKGVNIREWTGCDCMISSWFAHHEVGYGDSTIERFESDTGLKVPESKEPSDKLKDRQAFLVKDPKNRALWFKWRADQTFSLRTEILAEIRGVAPHMRLFASYRGLLDGSLGNGLDGRLANDPALGFGKSASYGVTGIEVNDLDPYTYKSFDIREGVEKSPPEDKLASGTYDYPMGMCAGSGLISPPATTRGLAQALARRPLSMVLQESLWVMPITDDYLRRWIRTWRAIPPLDFKRLDEEDAPVVRWEAGDACGRLVCYLVNTTGEPVTVKLKLQAALDMVTGLELKSLDAALPVEIPAYGLRLLRHDSSCEMERPKLAAKPGLEFLVRNRGGLQRKSSLVVVKGSELLARLPEGAVPVDSLRVADVGKPVPVQVDEMDGSRNYVDKPNKRLDPDDELCFLMSFAAGELSRKVEVSLGSATEWPSSFVVETTTGPTRDKPYDLMLRDGSFEVGFTKPAKRSAPGLSFVADRGVPLWSGVHPGGGPFNSFMRFPWPSAPSDTRLLAAGPVRALVDLSSTEAQDIEWFFEGNNVDRHFKNAYLTKARHAEVYQIVAGSCSIQARDRYDYAENLIDDFNVSSGYQSIRGFGGPITDKVALYSEYGELKTSTWSDDGKVKEGFGLTGANNENWLAVWDVKAERGLEIVVPPKVCEIYCGGAFCVRYRNAFTPKGALAIDRWVMALPDGKPETAARLNDEAMNPLVIEQ